MLLHVDAAATDVQIRDGLHILWQTWEQELTWCWPSCGPASCSAAAADPRPAAGSGLAEGMAPRTRDSHHGGESSRTGRGPRPPDPAADHSPATPTPPAATEVIPWLAGTNRNRQVLRSVGSSRPGRGQLAPANAHPNHPPGATYPVRRCRPGWRSRCGRFAAGYATAMSMVAAAVGGAVEVSTTCTAGDDIASACAAGVWLVDDCGVNQAHGAGRAGPPAHRRDGTDRRDAPHVVTMSMTSGAVADLDEAAEDNHVRAHLAGIWPTTERSQSPLLSNQPGCRAAAADRQPQLARHADLAQVHCLGHWACARPGWPRGDMNRQYVLRWPPRIPTPVNTHRRLGRLLPVSRRHGGHRAGWAKHPAASIGDTQMRSVPASLAGGDHAAAAQWSRMLAAMPARLRAHSGDGGHAHSFGYDATAGHGGSMSSSANLDAEPHTMTESNPWRHVWQRLSWSY